MEGDRVSVESELAQVCVVIEQTKGLPMSI